jgi:hypothetical protein
VRRAPAIVAAVALLVLGGEPARIRANLAERRSAGTGLFADYLLMDGALGTKTDLTPQAASIPDEDIDSANTRAYLEASLATR